MQLKRKKLVFGVMLVFWYMSIGVCAYGKDAVSNRNTDSIQCDALSIGGQASGVKHDSWKDKVKAASKLTSKKTYGTLRSEVDNSLYKVEIPKNGEVTLRFDFTNTREEIGWGYALVLYDKNGKMITTYKAIRESRIQTFYAKKGTYYLEVRASNTSYPPSAGNNYSLRMNWKVRKVSSMKKKNVSFTIKRSKLKWNKVKKVDGYEIQVCKNRKFKAKNTHVLTTTEKELILPNRIKKGKYYVRIRAFYYTVSGDKIYGKFTKVKRINKKRKI